MFDIKKQLSLLPKKPGVYLMKDKYGNIIYIGKAKNLKNRVSSYFLNTKNHNRKTKELVLNIVEFEYFITDLEIEALILEANLIKKYQPHFNILLRDDKNYPYIKITLNEEYPRVMKVYKVKKDKAKYYGPYVSGDYLSKILHLIRTYYPLRTCTRVHDPKRDRPCLNYDIKKCLAPCFHPVDQKEYDQMIKEVIDILEGKVSDVITFLEEKMKEHAENLQFEKAGEVRDTIRALSKLEESQKVYTLDNSNRDIIAYYQKEDKVLFMVFFMRDGKLLGREHYMLDFEVSAGYMLSEFLKRFYTNAMIIPKEILLSSLPDEKELIEEFLCNKRGSKVSLQIPKIGDKKRLVELVEENAKDYLEKFSHKIESEQKKIEDLKIYFKELFDIEADRLRVEAYDISNIFGAYSVGSMVVFENGKKKRNDYRKFNIKTIEGADDYGSMREVISRRFHQGLEERKKKSLDNKFDIFPDMLLIDGGQTHVNAVESVMDEMNIDIPVLGMVKDRKHKTRALIYKNEEYDISGFMDLYRFIYKVQEEVHRFAIEHHKTLRLKAMKKSILDDIPGIGKKRRTELIRHFKTIENIKKASKEELLAVDSIDTRSADSILSYFKERS